MCTYVYLNWAWYSQSYQSVKIFIAYKTTMKTLISPNSINPQPFLMPAGGAPPWVPWGDHLLPLFPLGAPPADGQLRSDKQALSTGRHSQPTPADNDCPVVVVGQSSGWTVEFACLSKPQSSVCFLMVGNHPIF